MLKLDGAADRPSRPRASAVVLMADPPFILLWLAGGLAGTIRWLDVLATGIFAYHLTASAIWVSVVLFLRLVPMLVLGAFVGVIVDGASARGLLIASALLLAITYVILAWLAADALLTIGWLAIGCIVSGSYQAIETPVRRTMLAEVAGHRHIGSAMTFELSTSNLTRMLGPAVGGLLYEWLGMTGVYALGALFSIASALMVWKSGIGGRPTSPIDDGIELGRGALKSVRGGIRYIRTDAIVQAVLFCTVVVNLFGVSYLAVVPVIGASDLHLSAFPIGLLMSAEGAGAFVGALLLGLLGPVRHFHRFFLYGSILYLTAILCFALSPNFPMALAMLLIGGVGGAGFSTMQSTLILSQAPPRLRHQLMGVLMICIGSGPIGVLLIGLLTGFFRPGIAVAIVTSIGLLLLAFAAVRWPGLRRLRIVA